MTVASGKVTAVKVLEGALAKQPPVEIRGGQTIDALFKRVIDAQSLKVDVISGATITSKIHLKAVEEALLLAGAK
ncbi:MAG: FMN-binding protein [Christensenellales bacterium]